MSTCNVSLLAELLLFPATCTAVVAELTGSVQVRWSGSGPLFQS